MGRALAGRLVAPVALLAALLATAPARAEQPVPPLTGPVVDLTGTLGPGDVARLETLARQARAENGGAGVQLQLLLLRTLDGEAIEDYSMRVAEAWQIGSHQAGNGVLLTVALDDHQVRIEVGQGLEGDLTDAQSGRIIRDVLAPAFRAGRYGDGLYQASVQILGALGALPEGLTVARKAPRAAHPSSLGVLGLVVFFVVLRILSGFGGRRRRSLWGLPWIVGGGGGWRGGGGFGGGGGGGWSGGGGGFSGGGASGSW
jgi:uncharacterized protein